MEELKDYLRKPWWDGHIHLAGDTNVSPIAINNVALASWTPSDDNRDLLPELKKWQQEHPFDIVLANGVTYDYMKKALEDKTFQGIGEINVCKIYKRDESKPVIHYKDWNLFDLALEDGRPIYIHCDLEDRYDIAKLEKRIQAHPNVKINICHLGCNSCFSTYGNLIAIKNFIKLQTKYHNVWGDISWIALDTVLDNHIIQGSNPEKVSELDLSRIIIGSDLFRNPANPAIDDIRKQQILELDSIIHNAKNIQSFFNTNRIPKWL